MADRKKPTGLLDAFYNVGSGISSDLGTVADWFADSYQDPVGALKGVGSAIAGAAQHTAELPKRAFESSETMRLEGPYNPEPIVEAATLPMGTGAIAGVPLKAGEEALGAGLLRKPPLVGVYHGTGSPAEYSAIKPPPPTHDLGIHTTIDPYVTEGYQYVKAHNPEAVDFMSGMKWSDPDAAGIRVKPFVGDFQSALRYPTDAIKWNKPENVIGGLENEMRSGFAAPRGLLEDMHNIAGSEKMWQDQFIPMLKDKGYDSLFYPHDVGSYRKKYNTFMAFDPEQLTPRFSPEGQQLIKERGIKEPMTGNEYFPKWSVPQGILKNPDEVESLKKTMDPKKNTFKWWAEDAPESKIKELGTKVDKEKAIEAAFSSNSKALQDDLKNKKITTDDMNHLISILYGNEPKFIAPHEKLKKEIFSQYSSGKISQKELEAQHELINKTHSEKYNPEYNTKLKKDAELRMENMKYAYKEITGKDPGPLNKPFEYVGDNAHPVKVQYKQDADKVFQEYQSGKLSKQEYLDKIGNMWEKQDLDFKAAIKKDYEEKYKASIKGPLAKQEYYI